MSAGASNSLLNSLGSEMILNSSFSLASIPKRIYTHLVRKDGIGTLVRRQN